MRPQKKCGSIAYLDVLGWKSKLNKDKTIINNLYYLLESTKRSLKLIMRDQLFFKIIGMADTIAIFLEERDNDSLEIIGEIINTLLFEGAKYNIFFRGAIAYGHYLVLEHSDFYNGEVLEELSLLCEACDWIGVVLTKSAIEELNKKRVNNQKLKKLYLNYNNIPFKPNIIENSSAELLKNAYAMNLYYYEDAYLMESCIESSYEEEIKEKSKKGILEKYKNTLEYISYIKTLYL